MQIIPVLFWVRRGIPILLCLLAISSATATFMPAALFASPPEEKLPDLSKPQLHREKTKLELAVDQAAAMLLQGKLPPTEDGVRFALWLYGDKGDVAYLDIATKMARQLVKTDAVMGSAALFWVAQAGGPTLKEAKDVTVDLVGDHRAAWRKLAMIAATQKALGATDYDRLFEDIGPPPTDRSTLGSGGSAVQAESNRSEEYLTALEAHIQWLGLDSQVVQFLGDAQVKKNLVSFTTVELDDVEVSASSTLSNGRALRARASLAAWEAALLVGDATLLGRSKEMLEGILDSAIQDSNAAAIAALAAGRMSRRHLQLAIIGDLKAPDITALRQAAYFLFEPNKIILNLDPKTDSKRMAELMYSPDAAPAMFVCVETLCSPPIKDPAELEKQVAEIKKLAAEVQQ